MAFKNGEGTSHTWLSIFLVVMQFLLIAFMMFIGPLWPTHWGLKGLMILGGSLGLWAFIAMGLGNIRAFPDIPQHGWLVVHGPYHWVRHPMYTSLLLITLGWVIEGPVPLRMTLWVGLMVTLWVKLRYEEQLLLVRFPSYEEYRKRTKRIVPFLF